MHGKRLWKQVLGVQGAVLEGLEEEPEGLVARVRLADWSGRRRCGVCGAPSPGYDRGPGPRRWRSIDLGTRRAYIEAEVPRVECPQHGVVVARLPWARHGSGFTRAFEDQTCWLVAHTSRLAVSQLMRVDWATVGRIVERAIKEAGQPLERIKRLRKIGVDELSIRRGQRYITVVVDHESGYLIWAAEGRDSKTLHAFFDLLGPEKTKQIRLATCDAAPWYRSVLRQRCPGARICMDAFHVVAWATEALDEIRRRVWNQARRSGQRAKASALKGARFALWKNPEDLTQRQQARLADIERTNKPLFRAYLLKEQLRQVFAVKGQQGIELLSAWLNWASRSRLEPFVRLARNIRGQRPYIEAALEERIGNARIEGVNTRLRLLTRIAFGFRTVGALIASAMLVCGGLCPPLPGRG